MIEYTEKQDTGNTLACFINDGNEYEIPVTDKNEAERQALFLEEIAETERLLKLEEDREKGIDAITDKFKLERD